MFRTGWEVSHKGIIERVEDGYMLSIRGRLAGVYMSCEASVQTILHPGSEASSYVVLQEG
jgi:hypothetical protein